MTVSLASNLTDWLFVLENRHQEEIQLGLSRIKHVAEMLDLLDTPATVITVAGTNGKGSTVALLESIYCSSGYKVGSYTSPHLLRFNERIKVNQQMINDADLIQAFEKIEEGRAQIPLTYFEVTTLAALWYFKQQGLDLIILEVGLGGRLDATNILDSDLAIITTVARDHEAYLGNTLDEIGFEKAGILRSGCQFIYADKNPPGSVMARAKALGVQKIQNGVEYSYEHSSQGLSLHYQGQVLSLPNSPLHANSVAAAVIASLCLQKPLPLTNQQLNLGIKNTVIAGRLQLITSESCPILLDVAHNPQAVSRLAAYLSEKFNNKTIHAVFSALADKDMVAMIGALKEQVSYWYPALLTAKRASTAAQINEAFKLSEVNYNLCYNTPILAYDAAIQNADSNDLVVVFGSFITVGIIMSTLSNPMIKEIV